jgi:hypothetical protein
MVPIRTRTVFHIRQEIPRDFRRPRYTISWQSVEIVEERPYCARHAPSVKPVLEETPKIINHGDHFEIPGTAWQRSH